MKGVPAIPEHELLREIGRGSHGEVWLARSVTGQLRAVKIVRRKAFSDTVPFEREFTGVQQFEPVSRRHEGFIDVLQVGFGPEREFFYCVMELADAVGDTDQEAYSPRTLESEMRERGKLPMAECAALGGALAEALAYLHNSGLVHRDVKPSNIVYVRGEPRLADIGLVSVADEESLVGTWGYSPRDGFGTPAADIFSLGKVLYELATGRDRTEFPELDDPSPEWRGLNCILLRACHEDATMRYDSAVEFASDLANYEQMAEKPLPRSWHWLRWVAGLVIIAGIGSLYWPIGQPKTLPKPFAHWSEEMNATDMPEGAQTFPVKGLSPQSTSVVFWFRTWDVTTFRRVLGSKNDATQHWGWVVFRGQLDFHWHSSMGEHRVKVGEVQPGQWHQAAIVFKPAEGFKWRAYLNGKVAKDYEKPQRLGTMGNSLDIGGPSGLLGQVRHLRVYSQSLTDSEVGTIYDQEKLPEMARPKWDWQYAYQDAFDENATLHILERQNVRAYREWQTPPITYWGPSKVGEPAWITYQFQFERPISRAFLRAGLKCFELEETQSVAGAGRGAGALSVSVDGQTWVPLRDALRPKPHWAIEFVYADQLPAAVLGARQLFVKMEFQTEGRQSDTFATAQHSWDRGRQYPPFELKVKFGDKK